MNLKHGFYSRNPGVNPDSRMLQYAGKGGALTIMMSLLDDWSLKVDHLHTSHRLHGGDIETLQDWFWAMCSQVEDQYDHDSAEVEYANNAALLMLALDQFDIDYSQKIQDLRIGKEQRSDLCFADIYLSRLVNRINAARKRI